LLFSTQDFIIFRGELSFQKLPYPSHGWL